MWTDEQRRAYEIASANAQAYKEDMTAAAGKKDWEAAGQSLTNYNRELSEMNALLTAGEKAYQAEHKAQEELWSTADLDKQIDKAREQAANVQKDKYYEHLPQDVRDDMEDAVANLAGEKSQANLDALNTAMQNVNASMEAAKNNDFWMTQSQQLDSYVNKMNELTTKNGGMDKWTRQQQADAEAIGRAMYVMADSITVLPVKTSSAPRRRLPASRICSTISKHPCGPARS